MDLTNGSDSAGANTAGTDTDNLTKDTNPTFTLGSIDPDAQSVEVFIDGSSVGQATNTGGQWHIQVDPANPLSEASHDVTAKVTDKAGNTSTSDALTVTVDTHTDATVAITDGTATTDAHHDAVINHDEQSHAHITGTIEAGAHLDSLVVTDSKGNAVTVDTSAVTVNPNGTFELNVDLTKANGESGAASQLVDGDLSVAIHSTDIAGNSTDATSAHIQLDTTTAVPTLNGLANPAHNSDNTPPITGSAEPNAIVTIKDNGAVIATVTANKTGDFSFTPAKPLPDGDHSFTASAVDTAGNHSKDSQPLITHIDASIEAPKVTLTDGNHSDSINATEQAHATLSGELTDIVIDSTTKVTEVVITDSTHKQVVLTPQQLAMLNGNVDHQTGHFSLTDVDLTSLTDGDLTVTLTATDAAGNHKDGSATAHLDTSILKPSVKFEKAGSDGIYNAQEVGTDGTVTATITPATDAQSGDVLTYTVGNGQTQTHTLTDTDLHSGFNVEVHPGESVSATVTDAAGNTSPAGAGTAATADLGANAPKVDFESAGKDGIYNAKEVGTDGTVTAIITPDTDAKSGDVLTYTVGSGQAQTHTLTDTDIKSGFNVEVIPGESVSATVTDAAGNTSLAGAGTAAKADVDILAPKVTLTDANHSDSINATEQAHATLSGELTDIVIDSTTKVTEVVITDSAHKQVVLTPQQLATLNGNVDHQTGHFSLTDVDLTSLTDGDLTVTLTATDAAGNHKDGSATAHLDTTISKPVVDLINGSDSAGANTAGTDTDNLTKDTNPTFTLGSIDPDAQSVEVFIDGSSVGQATNTGSQWHIQVDPTNPLSDASHDVTAKVTDKAGNTSTSDALTVTVDTHTDATVAITDGTATTDAHHDAVINHDEQSKAHISGQIEAGAHLDSVVVTDSKGNAVTVDTSAVTVNPNGTFELNVDLTKANGVSGAASQLIDGDLSVAIHSTDKAGNPSPQTTVHIQLDTTTAVPTLNGLANPAHNSDNTPPITGSAEPNAIVTIKDNGAVIATVTADKTGDFSFTPSKPLPDGDHSFTASAIDTAGNHSKDSQPLITHIDASIEAPKVTLTDGNHSDSINTTEQAHATLSGELTDIVIDSTTKVTEVVITDSAHKQVVLTPQQLATLNGNVDHQTGHFSLTDVDLTSLTDGDLTVTLTATDAAGNHKDGSATAHLDTTISKPVVDLTNGSDSAGANTAGTDTDNLTKDTNPTFTLGSIDPDAQSVEVFIDGSSVGQATNTGGQWHIQVDHTNSLSDASHDVTAKVTDKAGNTSTSDALTVTVDTHTDATVAITDGTATTDAHHDAVINQDEQSKAHISGQIEAGAHLDSVVVTDSKGNAVTVDTSAVTVNPNGTFELNVDLTKANGESGAASQLVDGDLSVAIHSTDIAGNSTDAIPAHIQLDTTTAVPTLNGLANPAHNSDNTPPITGSAEPNAIVTIKDNGAVIATVTADKTGDFSFTPAKPLPDGDHSFTASAIDTAGNHSKDSQPLITHIDTTAGTIAINAPLAGDNWLNVTEQGQPLEISGTTSGIEDHQVVTVSFNGQDYTATVSNNAWTLSVPATDLSGIKDATPLPITANVMDAAGNPAPQASHTIDVDLSTTASISITDGLTGDGVINAAESSSAHIEGTAEVGATLSGLSIHDSAGNTVNISAKDMPKVDSNGHFSLDNVDVSSLTDGKLTVQVTSTDAAGNTTSASGDITLDATAGTIAINAPIAGDNWLNGTEQGQPLEISGTTSGIEDHQVVTVSFNGQDYTATVSNNAWTLSVPATDLSGIKDATPLPITANVMDAAGNPAPQASHTIDVDLSTTASISITDGSTGDGVINAAESSSAHIEGTAEVGATLSGLSIHDSAGNTVNISAKDMPKVDSNGHFSLDNVDVSSLTDGKLTVQVTSTDAAGNTASASGHIELDTNVVVSGTLDDGRSHTDTTHLFQGDGFININEQMQTRLYGTLEAGATLEDVTLSDGTHTYHIAQHILDGVKPGHYSLHVNLLSDLVDDNGDKVNLNSNQASLFTVGDNTQLEVRVTAKDNVGNTGTSISSAQLDTHVHTPGKPGLTHISDGRGGRSNHDLNTVDGTPGISFTANQLDKTSESVHIYDTFKQHRYEIGEGNTHKANEIASGHHFGQFKSGYYLDETSSVIRKLGVDGTHIYQAEIHDEHGNVGQGAATDIIIDTHIEKPILSINNPAENITPAGYHHASSGVTPADDLLVSTLRPDLKISNIDSHENLWKVELIEGNKSLGIAAKNESGEWGHLDNNGKWANGLPKGFSHNGNEWVYTPQHDLNSGPNQFQVKVTDVAGNHIETILKLTQLNHAPTAENSEVSVAQNNSHTMAISDFGHPTDPDAGDHLSVVIETLPDSSHGKLLLNGYAVHVGDSLSISEIENGHVTFTAPDSVTFNEEVSFHVTDGRLNSETHYINIHGATIKNQGGKVVMEQQGQRLVYDSSGFGSSREQSHSDGVNDGQSGTESTQYTRDQHAGINFWKLDFADSVHLTQHVDNVHYRMELLSEDSSTKPGTEIGYFDGNKFVVIYQEPKKLDKYHTDPTQPGYKDDPHLPQNQSGSIWETNSNGEKVLIIPDIAIQHGLYLHGVGADSKSGDANDITYHFIAHAQVKIGGTDQSPAFTDLTDPVYIYVNKDRGLVKASVKGSDSSHNSGAPHSDWQKVAQQAHDHAQQQNDEPIHNGAQSDDVILTFNFDDIPVSEVNNKQQSSHVDNPYLNMVHNKGIKSVQHSKHDIQHEDLNDGVSHSQPSHDANPYLHMAGVDPKDVKTEHTIHDDHNKLMDKHFAHNPLADDFHDPNHGQDTHHDAFANPLEDKHEHKIDKHHHDVKHNALDDTGIHDGNHKAHDHLDNHLSDPNAHHNS
ncbi:hypothetical protein A9264_08095 [Vibrio sp. UCD-FRSSP16_10]|nr:hypothetical protein A9264_08095 [Vibrio sp. UCD-FRSSP16_10]